MLRACEEASPFVESIAFSYALCGIVATWPVQRPH